MARPPLHHVAILHRRYLKLILAGSKTAESRITRSKLPPWGRIAKGDIIHFKQVSGPFVATAVASNVHSFDELTPQRINQLKAQFNHLTLGPPEYWQQKQNANYATIIELANVTPACTGPAFPKSYGLAWFVLDKPFTPTPPSAAAKPHIKSAASASTQSNSSTATLTDHQTLLTAGALKNRYLRAPDALPPGPVTLLIDDDTELQTHVTPARRFATRKWAAAFKPLKPGAIAHFVPQGNRRYRVRFQNNP